MKRILVGIAAVLLALSFVAPTAADAQKKKDKKPKVKTYDFSGDNIDGDLVKPDGADLNVIGNLTHTSLIRIRTNFIKEILKSAEDL